MHPPFGFALFYLRSVAPKEVKTTDIYWGAIPLVLIQVFMVIMVLSFPGMVGVPQEKITSSRTFHWISIPARIASGPPGIRQNAGFCAILATLRAESPAKGD